MDGLWDPPYYQDAIEEMDINMKCCIHVLEILVSKADDDIVEHEEVLMELLSQLACTDAVFSDMYLTSLRGKIDFLDTSISKLKDDAESEEFLLTRREPAESIYDLLKSVFCCYLQKKDLQSADNTGTASSSSCHVRADNPKKQIGSSSNANQMEKIKTVSIIPLEKETISRAIVKVEEENTSYPIYDESMTLATVPCLESSEESNAIIPYVEPHEEASAMIPYVDSHEEANAKPLTIKELDFPPGYPNPQRHQKQSTSHSLATYSTRTYIRRKKPNSPLQTSSNSCRALVVGNPLDRAETYSNLYMEDYYTVNDLRAIAKQLKFKGIYKLRKAELAQTLGIKLIEGRRKQPKRKETQLVPMRKCEP